MSHEPDASPSSGANSKFAIPHSLPPPRRDRTCSQSERASRSPLVQGRVVSFCRQKGHGFIVPNGVSDTDAVFVHISDIDEEFVPVPGDEVEFRLIAIPPKNEKFEAVHVKIVHLAPGVTHHKWSDPPQSDDR